MSVHQVLRLRPLAVIALVLSGLAGLIFPENGHAGAKGQLSIALDFSIAPTFFALPKRLRWALPTCSCTHSTTL